jgi:hypothetical protein
MAASGLSLQDQALDAGKIDVVAGELLIDVFEALVIAGTLAAPIGQTDSAALVDQRL